MVVVVVVILHTGESPDVRLYVAEEGLSPAAFRLLRLYIGVNGRESVHPFVNVIISKHHFACSVVPVVDGIHQRRALRMLEEPSLLCF